ncbi:MAG TPA: hypothetical protein VFM68_00005, partial [Candidatus Saccharimonadales bacterium]|nr:hypothetical protein [Candidatus Saccharimonadales bacterium]
MSANSSDKPTKPDAPKFAPAKQKKRGTYKWWLIFSLPAWVLFGFLFAQVVLAAILGALVQFGVPFDGINESVLNTTFAACVYLLSFAIVVGLPWIIKKRRTTTQELGLQRLPSWMDIGLAPAALIVYLLASGIAIYLAIQFLPGFNAAEPQEVGFDNLNRQYEYLLAFATLVIIAPIAEEVLF